MPYKNPEDKAAQMRDYRAKKRVRQAREKLEVEIAKVDACNSLFVHKLRDRIKLMVERTINSDNPTQEIQREINLIKKRQLQLHDKFKDCFEAKNYVDAEILFDLKVENNYLNFAYAHQLFFPLYQPYLIIKKEVEKQNVNRTK